MAITFDQGRVHLEIDLDISNESLNQLIKLIAQNVPTAFQSLQSLTTEKTPEVPPKPEENKDTSETIPVG